MNVADMTHFNKMVITIVFLVRSASRYCVQKWIRRRDKVTATGTERSALINHTAATTVEHLRLVLVTTHFSRVSVSYRTQ